MKTKQTIILHQQAPDKPDYAAKCNGCGVCCAAEPCPVAHLLLWQFRGACKAWQWQKDKRRYQCGMVVEPKKYLRFLPEALTSFISKWCAVRIALDIGCDSKVEFEK
ncbi:hypothetical protein MCAMS1_02654 [biofilm metagenome]